MPHLGIDLRVESWECREIWHAERTPSGVAGHRQQRPRRTEPSPFLVRAEGDGIHQRPGPAQYRQDLLESHAARRVLAVRQYDHGFTRVRQRVVARARQIVCGDEQRVVQRCGASGGERSKRRRRAQWIIAERVDPRRLLVERDDPERVVRFQTACEQRRCFDGARELGAAHAGASIDQQDRPQREGSRGQHKRRPLGFAVFQHQEVVWRQVRQEAARRVPDADIESHQVRHHP